MVARFETSLLPLLAQTLTQGIELLSLPTDTRGGLISSPPAELKIDTFLGQFFDNFIKMYLVLHEHSYIPTYLDLT